MKVEEEGEEGEEERVQHFIFSYFFSTNLVVVI